MTFDIGLHEVCVRTGVRYAITKFSGMDGLPNFLTHGAPLRARFARAGAPLKRTNAINRALAQGTQQWLHQIRKEGHVTLLQIEVF